MHKRKSCIDELIIEILALSNYTHMPIIDNYENSQTSASSRYIIVFLKVQIKMQCKFLI